MYKNTRRNYGERKNFGGFLSKIYMCENSSCVKDTNTEQLKNMYSKKQGRRKKEEIV